MLEGSGRCTYEREDLIQLRRLRKGSQVFMDSFLFFSLFYFSFLWFWIWIFVGSFAFTSVVFGSILMPPLSFQAQHCFALDYLPSFHAHSLPPPSYQYPLLCSNISSTIRGHAWPRLTYIHAHLQAHPSFSLSLLELPLRPPPTR